MKKTKMIAALFAASALSACAADVYSSNVVGYTKLDIAPANLTMLGVNFQAVGGGELTINEIFAEPADGAFVGGIDFASSDQIHVWNPAINGYKLYFFGDWSGTYGAEVDNKWYLSTDDSTPTTDTLPPGSAVWFLSKATTGPTFSVAGEVKGEAASITLAAGNLTMVANPFPVEVPINTLFAEPAEGTFVGGIDFASSDQIHVWDSAINGYKLYFFGDWAGAWGVELDNQWYVSTDDSTPTTDSIPVGGAVWFLSKGTSDVTLTVQPPTVQ